MNYATIKPIDVANGPGIRVSLFVSGCRNHCKGCFNPETWDFCYGEHFTEDVVQDILKMLEPHYIKGLSILGGDPCEPENVPYVLSLAMMTKAKFPFKDIWMYSGYTYKHILKTNAQYILKYIDVLVDGPFILELKNPKLAFRGSENQRILKLKNGNLVKVLAEGKQEGLIDYDLD